MTNELAIRILTGDVLGTSEQTQEAVKMAVKALSSAQPETSILTVKANLEPEEMERVVRKIKDTPVMLLPSTESERKKGKWIVDALANNIYRCSECGVDAPVEPTGGTEYKSNYCPNCGADMRLIDADALKAYIDAQIGRPFIGCTVGEALKILVDEQPTVEAEPRWISFTLRELTADEKEEHPDWDSILDCKLPDDGQVILVTINIAAGHELVMCDTYYDDDGSYLDSGYEIGTEATAWRPMPEPYKPEGSKK